MQRLILVLLGTMSLSALADESDRPAADAAPEAIQASPGSDNAAVRQKRAGNAKPARGDDVETVRIFAQRLSDTDLRRYSTAAKMVFGREELDRYGDSSIGEVLKRLPGVTISGAPGRGGDIRMRGLGHGYTMILINGEPAPRGFSLDSLAPEQVERIEVMRAPVAEHSTRAIAGIINVVLREDFVRRGNEARASLGWEQGRVQPNLSYQRSDSAGALRYNLAVNLGHRDLATDTRTVTTATNTRTGAPQLEQNQIDQSRSTGDNLHLTSRLNWRLDNGDSVSLQPFLTTSHSVAKGTSLLEQTLGTAPQPYATANWRTESDNTMLRSMGNWQLKWAGNTKLDLHLTLGMADSDSRSARFEADAAGNPAHTVLSDSGIKDNSLSISGKYSQPIGQKQSFSAGWESEFGHRVEDATTVQDGITQLAQFGSDITAQTRRLALYTQDEVEFSPRWSAYAGLRWEDIRTETIWAGNTAVNESSVASPLLHSVWRFSDDAKDQVRMSLTRSYRSPTLANLVPRPTLSANYPVSGTNSATSPDRAGNPALKPELAWGFDAALEHYFTQGGLLSASIFARSIDNLIRNVTSLQTVSWSSFPRWVSAPTNIAHASTRGVELEAKFRLTELMADAPPLDVRANYSHFWSSVDGVPGPNNRLDQQPTQTANLGLDYRMRSLPLTVGGNYNWTPAFVVQQFDSQIYYQGLKRVVDCYATWKFNPDTQLRLSASNLLHADYETANREILAGTDQTAALITKTYLNWAARLEIKF